MFMWLKVFSIFLLNRIKLVVIKLFIRFFDIVLFMDIFFYFVICFRVESNNLLYIISYLRIRFYIL